MISVVEEEEAKAIIPSSKSSPLDYHSPTTRTTTGDTEFARPGGSSNPPVMFSPRRYLTLDVCRTIVTILAWYAASNTTILTTKWLFTNHFPYPLTVTTYSNSVAFLWALLLSTIFPKLRPATPPSRHEMTHYIIPIGFCTGLEIGCSNLALKLLTVSFGTILKGGGPIFTFGFGLLFGLETFSKPITLALFLIFLGIALASLGEKGHEFQLFGFCLQLFSTALGGLRWAMTHKILQQGDDGDQQHQRQEPMSPLTATLYTSPMTALFVLPFAIGFEGSAVYNQERHQYQDQHNEVNDDDFAIFWLLSIMTGIATLVFLLLMSEYWLVKATSSLALSVAGVFKELLTIGGGLFFFAEDIDWLNVIGFVTCQLGIVTYVCLRTSKHGDNDEDDENYESIEQCQDRLQHEHSYKFEDEERLTKEEIEIMELPTSLYKDNENTTSHNNNDIHHRHHKDQDNQDTMTMGGTMT